MLWAQIKANLHGLWFLLRWPPQSHRVIVETVKNFGVLTQWSVYCDECGKTFGIWCKHGNEKGGQ